MPSQTQWIHIAQLVLAGAIVIAGIYNQMQLATSLGVIVGVVGSIGIYLGGNSQGPSLATAQGAN